MDEIVEIVECHIRKLLLNIDVHIDVADQACKKAAEDSVIRNTDRAKQDAWFHSGRRSGFDDARAEVVNLIRRLKPILNPEDNDETDRERS